MRLSISDNSIEMGKKAAQKVAELINDCIEEKGEARIMVSTGMSQFEFFDALIAMDIPWDKIEIFHLDEYVALPVTHAASFRKYLKERFVDKVGSKRMNYINGEENLDSVIMEMSARLTEKPIDIGIIGIGENAHIAFNDPPADFETTAAYHVVELDKKCRMQQVGEGWFASIEEVPQYAISVTVHQIMSCRNIVSVVPHKVKANAIKLTLETNGVTNMIPATKLKEHDAWYLYLDEASASNLSPQTKVAGELE